MRSELSSTMCWCIFAYRLFICTTMTTAESPDEWWQSVEVAYHMVFNKGLLTWEWQEGIRSAVFPLIYAIPMLLLKTMKCDTAWTIWFSSRLVQACIAFAIDYCVLLICSRIDDDLEKKELVQSDQNGNANNLENCTTHKKVEAANKTEINSNKKADAQNVKDDNIYDNKEKMYYSMAWPISVSVTTTALPFLLCQWYLTYDGARCYSNVAETLFVTLSLLQQNYTAFLVFASLSCMVRITSFMPLLMIFATHLFQEIRRRGVWRGVTYCCVIALPIGILALAFMSVVDYMFYKQWIFTPVRFVHYNLTMKISALYGTSPWYDYFFVRLPAILGPHLIFLFGIPYCIAHTRTTQLVHRQVLYLTFFVIWTIICYSFVDHKEFRFILPVLPTCIVLVSYVLSTVAREAASRKASPRSLSTLRIVKWLHIVFLLVNIIGFIFCGYVHRQGGVSVMREIRNSGKHYKSLDVISPCFFTPGLSYIHNKVDDFYFPNCPIKLDSNTKKLLPHDDFLYRRHPVQYVNWRYNRKMPSADEISSDPEWWDAAFRLFPANTTVELPEILALFEDVARDVHDNLLLPNNYSLKWRLYHATGKCDEDYTKYIEVYTRS